MFKKFLSYIFIASIIVSSITTPISASANAPKSDYVILKQTEDSVIVETKEMTTQEANLKQS
ncbi:hypothetical protein, partial [Anaerosporobacter sp.]|uniref:hypothetical protein n=1 Tax=Anaerosporobacter sp. TaxID=1872529 RepID=UPI00286F2E3F